MLVRRMRKFAAMKASKTSNIFRHSQIAIAASALFTGSIATAQNSGSSSGSTAASANQQSNSSQNRLSQNESNQKEVRVTRATNFLGTDVMSTDGRKVGDIADYYFDAVNAPHLKYVVISTGGFLGYGGDARTVLPESLTSHGDTVKLKLSADEYWNLPVLPQNRKRYLGNRDNAQRIAQAFDRSGQRSSSSSATTNQSTLVSFTELRNADVFDSEGQDLGRFVDVWVSLNLNRAPYAEISAVPASPFEASPRTRYAVPMTELQAGSQNDGSYRLKIDEAKLRDAERVSEAKGVQMVQSGEIGRAIIHVTVPEVDGSASRNARVSSVSE